MCDSSFLLRAVTDRHLMQQIRHTEAGTRAQTHTGGGQKNGKASLDHKTKALRQVSHINLRCD